MEISKEVGVDQILLSIVNDLDLNGFAEVHGG